MQATVSELGFTGLRVRPQLGRVLTESIGTDGVVPTFASEVKFLDRGKRNFSESIRQECLHHSRTRVWGSKMIRYRRSPLL